MISRHWRRCRAHIDFGAAAVMSAAIFAAGAMAQSPPPPPTSAPSSTAPAPPPDCGACGRVESIRQTTARQQWTPLGAGVGVAGAPDLGSQPSGVTSYKIGPGFTNQGMVVLGSAGGAAYKKTPNSYEQARWELTVKLDSGGVRVVTLSYEPFVHEGDRVRISGNNVELLE